MMKSAKTNRAEHTDKGTGAQGSAAPAFITPEEWGKCVDAVDESRISELSKWRGYGRATINLFKDNSAIGRYRGSWAFPNIDRDGNIVSIHRRIEPASPGAKADWIHVPAGVKSHAIVWGDLATAQKIAIHEGQWDGTSQVDKLGSSPFGTHCEWAIICTRSASNAGALAELDIPVTTPVYVFPQNDKVGPGWLGKVINVLGREVLVVQTPSDHKDLNEWGQNGLTPEMLQAAISGAVIRTEPKQNTKAQSQPEQTKKAPEQTERKAPEQLEEKIAQRLEAAALEIAKGLDGFYDCDRKEYLVKIENLEVYQARNEAQLLRDLRFRGLSAKKLIPGRTYSQADIVIQYLQQKHFVTYAGPLAGRKCGFYEENGARILVTNSPRTIIPVHGSWPILNTFLTQLLHGRTEPYGEDQLNTLYGWWKIAYESRRDERFQPGQIVAIAGPVECGKSLLQALITETLGGRSAKAALFLQGRTNFNAELFGAEHLILEDESASTSYAARAALGVNIKNVAANRIHPCHPKHRQIVNLAPWWRLSISLNDRPERLLVLPPLTDDNRDKIILLRGSLWPMPMPANSHKEKEAFWNTLCGELPAFLHFLTKTFTITEPWGGGRFGVKAFQHPILADELEKLSPAVQLLDLIDLAQIWEVQSNVWEGKALELRSLLMRNYQTARDATTLLSWINACGQYLNDLAGIRPHRVKAHRRADRRWFEIYRETNSASTT